MEELCVCPLSCNFVDASHWPSDHMIRSGSLIGQPPKIVSKILEDIFSKIEEEKCFKDFEEN